MTKTLVENRYNATQKLLILRDTHILSIPRFSKNQLVGFVGGEGTILGYQQDSGTWSYAVKMKMGPEPEMGRVGAETTILLDEGDIQEVLTCSYSP